MNQKLIALLRWVASHDWGILLMLGLIVGGTWAFVELADGVLEADEGPNQFDQSLLLAMRTPGNLSDPIGPLWFEEMMRDVTALGSTIVLLFITVSVIFFLLLERHHREASLILLTVAGGFLLTYLLKEGFDRPRPELVPRLSAALNASFPSGHSMLSAIVYLTMGTLLARTQPRRRIQAYILILAILLTIAVGISRVYLGVHWPTDVLAGWTAGTVWALAMRLINRRLRP